MKALVSIKLNRNPYRQNFFKDLIVMNVNPLILTELNIQWEQLIYRISNTVIVISQLFEKFQ